MLTNMFKHSSGTSPAAAVSPYGHNQQMGGGSMGMGRDNRDPMGQQRQQQYNPGQGLGGRPTGPPPPGYQQQPGQGLGYQGTGYGAPTGPGRGMMPGQGLGSGQQQYPGASSPTPPATSGFLGKLKGLFAGDEGISGQVPPSFSPGQGLGQGGSTFGNRPPPPPPPGMQHAHQQTYGYPGNAQGMPPLPPPMPTQQQQQYGGYPPASAHRQGPDEPQIILEGGGSSAASISAGIDQQGHGLGQPPLPIFPGMPEQQQQQQQLQQQSPSDGNSLAAAITTDPQVDRWPSTHFHTDCVLLNHSHNNDLTPPPLYV